MNRAERRKIMKKIPGYKKALKNGSKKAVDDLEKMFQKQWNNNQKDITQIVEEKYMFDDEILNDGERSYNDNGEDDIYND